MYVNAWAAGRDHDHDHDHATHGPTSAVPSGLRSSCAAAGCFFFFSLLVQMMLNGALLRAVHAMPCNACMHLMNAMPVAPPVFFAGHFLLQAPCGRRACGCLGVDVFCRAIVVVDELQDVVMRSCTVLYQVKKQ